MVEPERVHGEGERNRGESARIEERAGELRRGDVQRPDDRDRRPAPEHRPGEPLDERRQHEQCRCRADRANEIGPATRDGGSEADEEEQPIGQVVVKQSWVADEVKDESWLDTPAWRILHPNLAKTDQAIGQASLKRTLERLPHILEGLV